MSLEDDIHKLVLGLEGISVVFAADPLWKNLLKQVGSMLSHDDEAAPLRFVDCSMEESYPVEESTVMDSAVKDGDNAVMRVRLRVGTDGSMPAPALARAVAAAIRAHVSAEQPELDVVAAVEVSAIAP